MNDFLTRFQISDSFFDRYEELVTKTVIPYQEQALLDQIVDADKSHAVENFRQAAKVIRTGHCDEVFYGMVFQDSDVAKWLEAAAYSLAVYPDPELEKRCDALIALIGSAQHEDGYLNTYFTVKEPNKRWTNLQEAHELYCAGHMMEAAVAYFECTGNNSLLQIMCKMADHMYEHFITNQAEGYPGHPEVELALVRMYRATSNEKYLELAKHFINVRGVDSEYFIKEAHKKGWAVWGMNAEDKEYAQNHAPVRDQKEAVGHAVRAVYLYTGMADIAAVTKDDSLKDACERLWDNLTMKRMYVTGAIGSAYEGEAFTKDYHLPNDTAYAETCAAIGLIFFGRKMLELDKDSKYADVCERALYNCVLAGMQLDGKRFFYVNPLEVIPGISGKAQTHRHALPERPKWFGCACCPPNVARLISSISCYAWSEEEEVVYSHLFIGGTLSLLGDKGKLHIETKYPYKGKVCYTFEPEEKEIELTLAIRIPSWSKNTKIFRNGNIARVTIRKGYAYIEGPFTIEDKIEVYFDMSVQRIFANLEVSADSGKIALMRGPLVYCIEGVDNQGDILSLYVKRDGEIKVKPFDRELLEGTVPIVLEGYRAEKVEALYTSERPRMEVYQLKAIPYYTWGNRGLSQMRVWIPEKDGTSR